MALLHHVFVNISKKMLATIVILLYYMLENTSMSSMGICCWPIMKSDISNMHCSAKILASLGIVGIDTLNFEIMQLHHFHQSINNKSACWENHSIYQPTRPPPLFPKSSLLAINNRSICNEANLLNGLFIRAHTSQIPLSCVTGLKPV